MQAILIGLDVIVWLSDLVNTPMYNLEKIKIFQQLDPSFILSLKKGTPQQHYKITKILNENLKRSQKGKRRIVTLTLTSLKHIQSILFRTFRPPPPQQCSVHFCSATFPMSILQGVVQGRGGLFLGLIIKL